MQAISANPDIQCLWGPRMADLKSKNAPDKSRAVCIQPTTAFRRAQPNHSPWKHPSPPLPLYLRNPASLTCQLTQDKSPTKPRFCALRFPFSISFPSSPVRWNPDRCLIYPHPHLAIRLSRYVHPTRHIAVKSAPDTSLRASARTHFWSYVRQVLCMCFHAPFVVRRIYIYAGCYVCARLPCALSWAFGLG